MKHRMTRSRKWEISLLLTSGLIPVLSSLAAEQAPAISPPLSIVEHGGQIDFHRGNSVVLRYQASTNSRKQYVAELRTPNGVDLVSDAPPDHPWHHGMMFALLVDGVNYWEEPRADSPSAARFGQQHVASELCAKAPAAISSSASVSHQVAWLDDHGLAQLVEHRTITLANQPREAGLLLTWESQLAVEGQAKAVELSGAHYHGVGLRFTKEFTDRVDVVLPDGVDVARIRRAVRGSEELYDTSWCGYHAHLPKGDVTVAMFAAPPPADRPTRWFTMHSPFTFLSATLGYDEHPLRLERDKSLTLKYGFAAWDGRVDTKQIARAYEEWLTPPSQSR